MKGTKEELKKFLKEWLNAGTKGCDIQHDGWTCGTCFFEMMDSIEIPEKLQEGLWHIVLSVRGDYDDFDWENEYKDRK